MPATGSVIAELVTLVLAMGAEELLPVYPIVRDGRNDPFLSTIYELFTVAQDDAGIDYDESLDWLGEAVSDPEVHSFDQIIATIKSRISEHVKTEERLERAREEVIAPFSDQIEATVDEAYAGARAEGHWWVSTALDARGIDEIHLRDAAGQRGWSSPVERRVVVRNSPAADVH